MTKISVTPKNKHFTTRNMAVMAILAAIGSVLFYVEIPVVPPIYKLDFSSLPVLLGAFAMGPVEGAIILAVKALVGLLHSSSGGVGELADFIMGFAMLLPAGLIYRKMRTRKGAVIGMILGTVIATVAAVFVNYYIMIPFYTMVVELPMEAVLAIGQKFVPSIDSPLKFVLLITAPFNLLKWTVISVITGLIYKPLSPLLHGRR